MKEQWQYLLRAQGQSDWAWQGDKGGGKKEVSRWVL